MRKGALCGLAILIAALGFTGCGNLFGGEGSKSDKDTDDESTPAAPTSPESGSEDSGNNEEELFSDSPAVTSEQVLSATLAVSPNMVRSMARAASDEANKVFFRSSDIEFWQIDSIEDISGSTSAMIYDDENLGPGKTAVEQYQEGKSLAFSLGDELESIAFYPNRDSSKVLGAGLEENNDWDAKVQGFKDAGMTKINLVRLDIGDGMITFILDGERRRVLLSDGSNGLGAFLEEELEVNITSEIALIEAGRNEDGSYTDEGGTTYSKEEVDAYLADLRNLLATACGIDANSIIFIDKKYLSKPVLVDRRTHHAFWESDSLKTVGIELQDEAEYAPLEALLNNSSINYDVGFDVDGAFFIPFDPVDISSFDPAVNNLVFSVNWNIAKSIQRRGDKYYMANRLQKTALDFSVMVTVE